MTTRASSPYEYSTIASIEATGDGAIWHLEFIRWPDELWLIRQESRYAGSSARIVFRKVVYFKVIPGSENRDGGAVTVYDKSPEGAVSELRGYLDDQRLWAQRLGRAGTPRTWVVNLRFATFVVFTVDTAPNVEVD